MWRVAKMQLLEVAQAYRAEHQTPPGGVVLLWGGTAYGWKKRYATQATSAPALLPWTLTATCGRLWAETTITAQNLGLSSRRCGGLAPCAPLSAPLPRHRLRRRFGPRPGETREP